jgi:hypothetical protein
MHLTHRMMNFLRNLFGRPTRFQRLMGRQPLVTPRRGGIGLGTIAMIAAPFIIRRMRARRAMSAA